MNALTITKFAAKLIVGSGTTTITHAIIRNNVDPSNALEKVSTAAASVVVGAMAAEKTRAYTDASIDAFVDNLKKAKAKSSETPTEA